ncbi:hypothetical protein DXG01_003361, partial [Tephrocybe rancida]
LYEHAIDWGAELQRGIKEMDTWVQLADTLGADLWKARVDKMQACSIELANNEFLGSWVNGNLEDNTLLLLSLGVPCHLIHELDGDGSPRTERYKAQQQSKTLGWMDETDLDSSDTAKLNKFDRIVLQNRSKCEVHYSRLPRELARGSCCNRLASSALSQGWPGPQVGRHSKPPPPIPLIRHKPVAEEEVQIDPSANKQYLAKPLELVRVYKDQIEWIKPPPVISVILVKGEWTKWEQQVDSNFICKGRGWKHKEEDMVVYFDRENLRELVLEMEEKPPKGVVSDLAAFRMPAPVACYWKMKDCLARDRNSRWMYPHCHPPRKEWAGMVAPIPKEDELPLDYQLAAESLLGEVRPMDVDVEDSISLGSDGEEEDIIMSTETSVAEAQQVSNDAAETSLKASLDAVRKETQNNTKVSAPGILSCHLCQGALTTPRSHDEILKTIRSVGKRDLTVFISRVIITADSQIWVSTTTSDRAQSFANSGILGGLWDYVLGKEIDKAEKTAVYCWDSPREPVSPSLHRSMAPTLPTLSTQQRSLPVPPNQVMPLSSSYMTKHRWSRSPERHRARDFARSEPHRLTAMEAQINTDGIKKLLTMAKTGTATSLTLHIPLKGGSMVNPLPLNLFVRHVGLDEQCQAPLPSMGEHHLEEWEVAPSPKPSSPVVGSLTKDNDGNPIIVDEEEQKIILLYAAALKVMITAHQAGALLPLPLGDPVLCEVPGDPVPRSLKERITLGLNTDDADGEQHPMFFEHMSEATMGEPPNVLNWLGIQLEEHIAEPGVMPDKKKRHRGSKKEKAKLERKRLHREADAVEAAFFGTGNGYNS